MGSSSGQYRLYMHPGDAHCGIVLPITKQEMAVNHVNADLRFSCYAWMRSAAGPERLKRILGEMCLVGAVDR